MAATATKTRGGVRTPFTTGDIRQRLEKLRKHVEEYDINSFSIACEKIFPSTGYKYALTQLGVLIRDDEGIYHWNSSFRISNTSAEKLIQIARDFQNRERVKYQKGDGKSGIKTSAAGSPPSSPPSEKEASVQRAADQMQTLFSRLTSDNQEVKADIKNIKSTLFDILAYVKPQPRNIEVP